MKRKTSFLVFALLLLGTALLLLTSCTYDGSFFKILELPEECAEGLSPCEGKCVATNTKEHCGACDITCTFDRLCEEQDDDSYQCRCPNDRTDCGPSIKCSFLDGGFTDKSSSDLRCGDCNTMCLNNELCQNKACVCPTVESNDVLRDSDGKPLIAEALFAEYLRNDEHCGGCNSPCKTEAGMHCVLGQCTKTRCDFDPSIEGNGECHFMLFDGREECQSCDQACRPMSVLKPESLQSLLIPMIKIEEKDSSGLLNVYNTSPDAYKGSLDKEFLFRRVKGCTCANANEDGCGAAPVDRCDAGYCVCGLESSLCPKDTTCTSQGCKAPCDDSGRACAGSAECSEQEQCLCLGAVTGDEPTIGIAHCVDGLFCNSGKCYCPGTELECGLHGDRCLEGSCVCGELNISCQGEAICTKGSCLCGESKTSCDLNLAPNCLNGTCVCGKDKDARACQTGEVCKDGKCKCTSHDACKQYGKIDNQGRGQADWCKDGGCVCGSTGKPCPDSRVCVNGQCQCTENSDCPGNETCESNQCTCGGAKLCSSGSTCSAAGNCKCDKDYQCNDYETCQYMPNFGRICVCSPSKKQKACKAWAKCGSIWGDSYGRCYTSYSSACHTGERLSHNGACVCGDTGFACQAGQTCDGKQCVENNTTNPSPPSGE